MAIMIPDCPKNYNSRSHEGEMFEELRKLSDDYYVFHSFEILSIKDKKLYENEIDFVIFNSKKGIICIEAKAGQVKFENGCWEYGSGIRMKHDGPYIQAKHNKWRLVDYMNEHGLKNECNHCKKIHAVWFPDVPLSKFKGKHLPAEGNIEITLTSDAFGNIEKCIEHLFEFDGQDRAETFLSEKEKKNILERVLAPTFNLISLQEVKIEHTKQVFKRMLSEQIALLNYLEEQNNAIINGLAGTGKTVMAVEKAKKHSENGEEVLFLCYNKLLKEHLKAAYNFPRIHYYTIDGLVCKMCNSEIPNYEQMIGKLEDMYLNDDFPYQHVIIDEGQDFGKIPEKLIELLKDNVLDNKNFNGTFYFFYDKNQMIQSEGMPKYLNEADCKLTLYKNCRNTRNIADTSIRFLGNNIKPKFKDDTISGDLSYIAFANDKEKTINILNKVIERYLSDGLKDITILTCKTVNKSIIAEYCNESKYHNKHLNVNFTTCRKFKGLESDVVIMMDIDKSLFEETKGEQIMYVGTSRARFQLTCITNLSEDDCIELMNKNDIKYNRNVFKSFATYLNAKILNI